MARLHHSAAYPKERRAEAHPEVTDTALYFIVAGLFLLIAACAFSDLSRDEIPGALGQPALSPPTLFQVER